LPTLFFLPERLHVHREACSVITLVPARAVTFPLLCWSVFTLVTGMIRSLLQIMMIRFAFGIGEGVYPACSIVYPAEKDCAPQHTTSIRCRVRETGDPINADSNSCLDSES